MHLVKRPEMPENRCVIVTLSPFYLLAKQSAGNPKKFLVEVPKTAIEKFGNTAADTSIALKLARETALNACTAHFGLDSGIQHNINTQLVIPEQDGNQMRETPYLFNDCRAWVQVEL